MAETAEIGPNPLCTTRTQPVHNLYTDCVHKVCGVSLGSCGGARGAGQASGDWFQRTVLGLAVSQSVQNPGPTADTFVEAANVVFFVGGMDAVVVLGKADQQGFNTHDRLEMAGDGY